MRWEVITPPTALPVSFADAKAFLRLDNDDEQAVVLDLIATATDHAERDTGRSIMPRTIRATFYAPEQGSWHPPLPMGPVLAVTDVTVQNGDTIPADAYELRRWGTGDYLHVSRGGYPVSVTYTAGHATVPPTIKTAILMHVVSVFENRGATSDRQQYATPFGLAAMYGQHRTGRGIA